MVVYTLEQRWEILRNYFENHVAECVFCRFWQKTNMVVYTLEQRWAKCACDRRTEDVDFGKKKK